MNILLVIIGSTGLQYHRQISPHNVMKRVIGNAVRIEYTRSFDQLTDNDLKRFDIVCFLRHISKTNKTQEVIDRCHRSGVKVVFDIDDYWNLPNDHPMYLQTRSIQYKQDIKDSLMFSDLITTTTKRLRDKIGKGEILPNCIDKTEFQWIEFKEYSPSIRFGWVGGVYHTYDIMLMERSVYKSYSDASINKKISFVLGGYNNNKEYNFIERIMSNNKVNTPNCSYKRIDGLDWGSYGTIYNHLDVALVPLRENEFTSCKSELKIVEASAKGLPVICSNVEPYCNFPDDVVIKIDKSENLKGWHRAIKFLANSDSAIEDYADRLKRYCNQFYNAEDWAIRRYEIYKQLISK